MVFIKHFREYIHNLKNKGRVNILHLVILVFIAFILGLIFHLDYAFTIASTICGGVFIHILGSFAYELFRKKIRSIRSSPRSLTDRQVELFSKKTRLSQERKVQIIKWVLNYERRLSTTRPHHLKEINKQQKAQHEAGNLLENPAWFSVSTTASDAKLRLTMGFRNKGCSYWRDNINQVGCFNCGYGSASIQEGGPSKQQLIKQFNKVLGWAINHNIAYDVIEFLNDGSFFNFEKEWPDGFYLSLFEKLRGLHHVKRILIETRPEHLTKKKLDMVLNQMGAHQRLEIGIGFETPDDFIREACINKGYGTQDFERALHIIAEKKEKCGIVLYTLIKPAFLSEKEAIEDVVRTLEYIAKVSNHYGIDIVPKIEPAVVAQGTILDILHFEVDPSSKEWYELLSYWSVVEIISRAILKNLENNIRVGAREDMDVIEKVPAIYNRDGTFNQYDFWVYDAVQQFNAYHDIYRFFADIMAVIEKSDSYDQWKSKVGIEYPAIKKCIEKYEKEIVEYRLSGARAGREAFLSKVFEVLDEIELEPKSHSFAQKIALNIQKHPNKIQVIKEDIQIFINDAFHEKMHNSNVHVYMYHLERDSRKMLRVYFQLQNVQDQTIHDIWVGIPTQNVD